MSADPWGRPLGTAPGEAFCPLIDPDERRIQRLRRLEDFAGVVVACAAAWFVVAYLLWWHV